MHTGADRVFGQFGVAAVIGRGQHDRRLLVDIVDAQVIQIHGGVTAPIVADKVDVRRRGVVGGELVDHLDPTLGIRLQAGTGDGVGIGIDHILIGGLMAGGFTVNTDVTAIHDPHIHRHPVGLTGGHRHLEGRHIVRTAQFHTQLTVRHRAVAADAKARSRIKTAEIDQIGLAVRQISADGGRVIRNNRFRCLLLPHAILHDGEVLGEADSRIVFGKGRTRRNGDLRSGGGVVGGITDKIQLELVGVCHTRRLSLHRNAVDQNGRIAGIGAPIGNRQSLRALNNQISTLCTVVITHRRDRVGLHVEVDIRVGDLRFGRLLLPCAAFLHDGEVLGEANGRIILGKGRTRRNGDLRSAGEIARAVCGIDLELIGTAQTGRLSRYLDTVDQQGGVAAVTGPTVDREGLRGLYLKIGADVGRIVVDAVDLIGLYVEVDVKHGRLRFRLRIGHSLRHRHVVDVVDIARLRRVDHKLQSVGTAVQGEIQGILQPSIVRSQRTGGHGKRILRNIRESLPGMIPDHQLDLHRLTRRHVVPEGEGVGRRIRQTVNVALQHFIAVVKIHFDRIVAAVRLLGRNGGIDLRRRPRSRAEVARLHATVDHMLNRRGRRQQAADRQQTDQHQHGDANRQCTLGHLE